MITGIGSNLPEWHKLYKASFTEDEVGMHTYLQSILDATSVSTLTYKGAEGYFK